MADKIYVENINKEGTLATTTNYTMMLANKSIINRFWEQDRTQSRILLAVGRFICLIMFDVNKETGMFFMDCKKNRAIAETVVKFFPIGLHGEFMNVFERVTKNYDKNYHEVELVIDKSFPSSSSN